MKKVLLSLVVLLVLTSCHTSPVNTVVSEDSILTKFKIDTIKVDSVKVINSIKSK
jgi:uncharacterized protein YcfL